MAPRMTWAIVVVLVLVLAAVIWRREKNGMDHFEARSRMFEARENFGALSSASAPDGRNTVSFGPEAQNFQTQWGALPFNARGDPALARSQAEAAALVAAT